MSKTTKYEAVIGLEIHVQLKTKSKMFCRCDNQSDGAPPNEHTCPVCLGMPGTLPVPNHTAVEWALRMAAALGCTRPQTSKFDRKQYFYPDLPKGYQITQYDQPLGGPGEFSFDLRDSDGGISERRVGITRLHLEEDAGKLTHPSGADYSLVDLNRAGTPLMEIVTEPDFRTPAEAKTFLQELRKLARFLEVSDADMEKGHLRADANISVRPVRQKELGVKTELKNLNSFKFVERGLAAEIERQTALLETGGTISQETRGFDEDSGKTVGQRSKEESQDYRYFPEPDIPPLDLAKLDLASEEIPELPVARQRRWRAAGVGEDAVHAVSEDAGEAAAFDVIAGPQTAKLWLQLRSLDGLGNPDRLRAIVTQVDQLLAEGKLARAQLIPLVKAHLETDKPLDELLAQDERFQAVDAADLAEVIDETVTANPKPVADYRAGNANALQALVGQVMKRSKGSANPTTVVDLLRKKLEQ